MNKTILDLANKAGVVFDCDQGTDVPEVYFDRQEDFEKFVELLVRECITQCNDGDSKYFIASHFGIE